MEYKVGDRVRLKILDHYSDDSIKSINELPNRVATIERVLDASEVAILDKEDVPKSGWYYNFKELFWAWAEKGIECTEEEYLYKSEEHLMRPVVTRYDLLDFED